MSDADRDPPSKEPHDTLPGSAGTPVEAVDASPARRSDALRRPRSGSLLTHPLTLLVATIAAIVIVWMIGAAAVRWREQVVAERAAQVARENERQAQQQAEQAQREAAEREARRQAQLEQADAARAQATADALRAQDDARVAEVSAADRKEKAWAKFYRKPSHCETSGSMDCVNGYIRARRAFEEKWNKAEF